ncbi:MAG: S8 family peptidase [Actinomycetota bacterium]|nr:S8 family peptidase [Actinomycetota bacterium]
MRRLRLRPGLTALAAAVVLPLAGLTGPAGPAAAAPPPTAPDAAERGRPVPGAYVVVLRDGADPRGLAARHAARPDRVYTSALAGFAARLTDGQRAALARDPDVVLVEQDRVVTADATQSSAPYGIDRLDQRALPLSGTYSYGARAGAVRAYVIDTGIATGHTQFGSRAMNVYDAFGGNGQDCNGHGTHVAGSIGAATYGVGKSVALRGLRVLDCRGSGSTSGILAAVDWLRRNHIKPAVANMSLGGGYSSSLNTAVTNLANAGVFVAVAAGNESQNACNVSPASASNVTAVGATDRSDTRASFSNYGSCVDVYAPGVSITSTWLSGTTKTISGTSMASPHAAGVGALYKAVYGDAASSTVNSWIINKATANVVKSNPTGTPNRLLYKAGL